MKNIKLKKLITMQSRLMIKKVARKLNNKIYYSYKKLKIKNNPITLQASFFYDFNTNSNFLYDIGKKEEVVCKLNKLSVVDLIIISANKICSHQFKLLGSKDNYLGEQLSWNEDFKTGFKWNNKFYKDIKLVDLYNEADVKVPWELSRFQHIFTIGKAYWITNDKKYAFEFKTEVEDWIEKNPVEMSVNWTCTMDVSIRVANWICGYFFFEGSNSIDDNFWNEFNKSLYLHGRFIYKNLENEGKHNSNHYLSDLVGLIWLGIYFGDFLIEDEEKKNNPKNWLRFGLSEFEKEIKKEVNEDGTNYESSTSYHRLVTEMFLITTIFCNKNDINFSKEYMNRLEKMCEFIMDITKPNGFSPIIGDADDGRLLVVCNYGEVEKRDFRHILAIAGEYFNRYDFRAIGKDYKEDVLWIMGNFKSVNKGIHPKSQAYSNGGYYILRNSRVYCLIRCGELSCRGEGGHSHNDQLSFELNVDGEDFIIDPGTYVYTSDYKMRNLFRSTSMHNTLLIDNLEQNNFNEYDLFYMEEQSFGKCKFFNDTTFYGEHYGYKEKCGVLHERKIYLTNDKLIIDDKLIGHKIDNNVYMNIILDNGVEIKEEDNTIQLNKKDKKIFLKFNNKYSIEDSFVSYGYGQILNSKKIVIEMKDMTSIIKIIYS